MLYNISIKWILLIARIPRLPTGYLASQPPSWLTNYPTSLLATPHSHSLGLECWRIVTNGTVSKLRVSKKKLYNSVNVMMMMMLGKVCPTFLWNYCNKGPAWSGLHPENGNNVHHLCANSILLAVDSKSGCWYGRFPRFQSIQPFQQGEKLGAVQNPHLVSLDPTLSLSITIDFTKICTVRGFRKCLSSSSSSSYNVVRSGESLRARWYFSSSTYSGRVVTPSFSLFIDHHHYR